MNLDSGELGEIARSECLELMRTAPIGRIVYTHRALPAIRPVRFAIVGGAVFIPTRAGSPLALATQDSVVAFQTEDYDPATHTGWSVTAVGRAALIELSGEVPPVLLSHGDVLRVDPEQISGHRIECPEWC